ncbi:hypothetical protein EG834_16550 [bacterium]|nr:hypothetical protein [bacterium]
MARRAAFTFGELMIILAILAVLAAIAVPNFMEGCYRSPVSRNQTGMRDIQLAMEAYRVDHGSYPVTNGLGEIEQRLFTTPIAYLSEVPFDRFRKKAGMDDTRYRIYVSTVGTSSTTKTRWMVSSIGPDLLANTAGYRSQEDVLANEALPRPAIGIDRDGKDIGSSGYGGLRYDPTNGTKSYGDLYKWGE